MSMISTVLCQSRSQFVIPTRLDGMEKDLSSQPTIPPPKRLPELMDEIGKDPREYFDGKKVDEHKEIVKKVVKNEASKVTEDDEDLKALLGGMNVGEGEWWKGQKVKEGKYIIYSCMNNKIISQLNSIFYKIRFHPSTLNIKRE